MVAQIETTLSEASRAEAELQAAEAARNKLANDADILEERIRSAVAGLAAAAAGTIAYLPYSLNVDGTGARGVLGVVFVLAGTGLFGVTYRYLAGSNNAKLKQGGYFCVFVALGNSSCTNKHCAVLRSYIVCCYHCNKLLHSTKTLSLVPVAQGDALIHILHTVRSYASILNPVIDPLTTSLQARLGSVGAFALVRGLAMVEEKLAGPAMNGGVGIDNALLSDCAFAVTEVRGGVAGFLIDIIAVNILTVDFLLQGCSASGSRSPIRSSMLDPRSSSCVSSDRDRNLYSDHQSSSSVPLSLPPSQSFIVFLAAAAAVDFALAKGWTASGRLDRMDQ